MAWIEYIGQETKGYFMRLIICLLLLAGSVWADSLKAVMEDACD